jgi:uncharacterized protein (DUF1015 family)
MADVAGFRAVGFATDKVSLASVTAPADVESATERARLAALDPHQVMRLLDPSVPLAGDAADPVAAWLQQGALRQDAGRALYRYHQEYTLPDFGARVLVRRGLLCAVRLPSLADGGVKAHQAVRAERVSAHAERMARLRLHAAPVTAAYRDPAQEVDRLFRKIETGTPTLQVQAADGTWHRLWRCGDAEIIGAVRHLFAPRKLYTLDGHERLAAMQAAGAKLAEEAPMPMYAAGNYATMCLFNLEDQALLPAPCHRLLGGAPLPAAEVLARAGRYFSIVKMPGLAQHPGKLAVALEEWTQSQACFALAFPGEADVWQLTLLPAVNPRDEGIVGHPAVTRLEPVVIDELLLKRVIGLSASEAVPAAPPAALLAPRDIEVTPPVSAASPELVPPASAAPPLRVERVTWVHDASSALAALASGHVWMAVLTRPLPMQHVVHVADLGQELPPLSTHFYPPVLGGLAMLRLTADEDLR